MRRNSLLWALLLCSPGLGAWAQDAPRPKSVLFESAHRTFAGEIPAGWSALETESPSGFSMHLLGPAEAEGAWRPAFHVHFMEKGRPGFIPLEAALKRARRSDKLTGRRATPIFRRKVAKESARRFEVTETRLAPSSTLPARPLVLHHYYALVPAGESYFVIKLSTTRDDYLDYRKDFERFLDTFRILGYQ